MVLSSMPFPLALGVLVIGAARQKKNLAQDESGPGAEVGFNLLLCFSCPGLNL